MAEMLFVLRPRSLFTIAFISARWRSSAEDKIEDIREA